MVLILLLIFAFLVLTIVEQYERSRIVPESLDGTCPGCSGRVEVDWLICPRCKELLQVTCHRCQAQRPAFHPFCTICGAGNETPFGGGDDHSS